MKSFVIQLTFFTYIPFTICGQTTVSMDSLIFIHVDDKPIAFMVNREEKFTGIAIEDNFYKFNPVMQKYQDGVLLRSTTFYESGRIKECHEFDDHGRESGIYIRWDTIGRITMRGQFLFGLKNGVWEFYTDGILIKRGMFLEDVMNGIWEYFDQFGFVIKREYYEQGTVKRVEEF